MRYHVLSLVCGFFMLIDDFAGFKGGVFVASQKVLIKLSGNVIPANAGIQNGATILDNWTPAFAGVTFLFCIHQHFLRTYRSILQLFVFIELCHAKHHEKTANDQL